MLEFDDDGPPLPIEKQQVETIVHRTARALPVGELLADQQEIGFDQMRVVPTPSAGGLLARSTRPRSLTPA